MISGRSRAAGSSASGARRPIRLGGCGSLSRPCRSSAACRAAGDVPGADRAQHVLETMRAIDLGVVGHHGLRRGEAEIGEVPDGAREALGVGGGVLAIVLLD